jgi:hypothetical protein
MSNSLGDLQSSFTGTMAILTAFPLSLNLSTSGSSSLSSSFGVSEGIPSLHVFNFILSLIMVALLHYTRKGICR